MRTSECLMFRATLFYKIFKRAFKLRRNRYFSIVYNYKLGVKGCYII